MLLVLMVNNILRVAGYVLETKLVLRGEQKQGIFYPIFKNGSAMTM